MADATSVQPAGVPRVFFYVQHLLGLGHLARAARVAKALAADGFAVALVMGGEPVPGLDPGEAQVVRLPPVKAGDGFSALLHPDGRAFDASDKAERARMLLDHFDRFAPDVLITEAFPFGRRQMRFELLPLLERASAQGVLVATSVRDILQRDRRPERVAETTALVARVFDLVLVHGDPNLARLDDSFPEAGRFEGKIAYTGLVAPPRPAVRAPSSGDAAIVVSAGGGAVGEALLGVALAARPLTRFKDRPWLLLTGPNMAADRRTALVRASGDGVTVASFVPDLAAVLTRADVSVSQAGYNTVADLLVAGCRAVLVPFARGGETEQTDRATLLAGRGFGTVIPEAGLDAVTLAAAIEDAAARTFPTARYDLDGAAGTARILRERLGPFRVPRT